MDGHKSRVFCACFHPKSMHELISGGWDDTIQFWDVRQAHSVRYISGVHICGDSLDISRNGKEVISSLLILSSPHYCFVIHSKSGNRSELKDGYLYRIILMCYDKFKD